MMRSVARLLWLGLSAAACGRADQPPPDRPSKPTLPVAPSATAPTTGRRVVAVGQIAQSWHVGTFSPASITLSEVAAGDAILVLGAYWGDLEAGTTTAPTDDHGTLTRIVDQGTSIVGRKKPPVFTQLYAELAPAPGAHTIIPAYLGGPAGDGTLYVVQVRGLTEHRVITVGSSWAKGTGLRSASAALEAPAAPGDLIVAIGGYDNTAPVDRPGWSPPPTGWTALGSQDDASNNVPSQLWTRTAEAPVAQQVTWAWTDPTVNVTAAVIAAIR
jgi:hypothetical protein